MQPVVLLAIDGDEDRSSADSSKNTSAPCCTSIKTLGILSGVFSVDNRQLHDVLFNSRRSSPSIIRNLSQPSIGLLPINRAALANL
jgi:hypothetical protein